MQVKHQARPLQSHPNIVLFPSSALNLIGPRAVDVLSELSYAPITPEHFPSLFCKVSDRTSFLLALLGFLKRVWKQGKDDVLGSWREVRCT